MPFVRGEARQPIEGVCAPTKALPRGSQQPVVLGSCSPVPARKYWLNRKRKIFPGVLFAVVLGVLAAFGTQAADAQISPSLQAGRQQSAAQSGSGSATYCKQSTLTGPAFLNLLNTIVKHGDLTDIAFLQKTLGTKFSMSYGLWYGNPDHQEQEYDSDQVLGSPFHVHVDVDLDVIEGKPSLFGNAIAGIRFEGTGNFPEAGGGYINDCMELPVKELESRYGAEGFRQIYASPPGNGPLGESTRAKFPGQHNTKLGITWLYSPVGRIQVVAILQSK
jgi:hypothetical protein